MKISNDTRKKMMFINGGEVLDIDIEKNEFCILSSNGECLQKVNFENFVKDALKYKDVAIATWSTELKNEYIDILVMIIKKLIKEN